MQDKEDSGSKNRRRSGDVMEWLREKVKMDTQIREEELKEKKEEGQPSIMMCEKLLPQPSSKLLFMQQQQTELIASLLKKGI